MLRNVCSLFLDTAVVVEALLCDEDSLGDPGEDWRSIPCDHVENCEESEIYPTWMVTS